MSMIHKASVFNARCPVYRLATILESKWALIIIRDLLYGSARRFKDFKKSTPQLTDRALQQTLVRLQEMKIVKRVVKDTSPPQVIYTLTHHGKSLRPIYNEMVKWGKTRGKKWWQEII
jgi:DNA-binding HxlR family transcriptional regulator